MIIYGNKIVSAGCFLPLSQNVDSNPKDLGTRHRAGIGITETIDVITFIVSEETGIISIARAGKIVRYADIEMLKKTLANYYWEDLNSAKR
jgi:diadenylate cyclase